jgi:collagen type VII alpha
MNFRGAWVAGTNYAVDDAVTFDGASYLALTAGSGKEPDLYASAWMVIAAAGGVGPTGAGGTAATVSVGTVTTGAAGTAAAVTNSGSSAAAVLNFVIPQGVAGSAGSSGSAGTASASGGMYHPVNYASYYYAVTTSASSATETASVLMWVPLGCTATRMDVFSQQTGNITVTLRVGSTASNLSNTALSCLPATSGSCPAVGSVVLPAGGFVDISITGASSTLAGVWTALQCQ